MMLFNLETPNFDLIKGDHVKNVWKRIALKKSHPLGSMRVNQLSAGSIELLNYTIHQPKQRQERSGTEKPTKRDNNSNLDTPFAPSSHSSHPQRSFCMIVLPARLLCLFNILLTFFSSSFRAFLSFSHGLLCYYKHRCSNHVFLFYHNSISEFGWKNIFGLCTTNETVTNS